MFENDAPLPPAADRSSGQPEQKIRKRQECHGAGREIAEMVELVAEDFCAQAKIVLTPGQE